MSADFVLVLGDRPSRKQIGCRMSLNAPCTTGSPIAGIPRRRTFPQSFGISTWPAPAHPPRFGGPPGTQDRARPTPDGLYLKYLAEAARARRDAVALYGGQVRLAWHSRLPSR